MKTLTLLELAPDFFKKEDLIQFFQSAEFKDLNYDQLEHFIKLTLKGELSTRALLIQIFGKELTSFAELILNHHSAYKTVTENNDTPKQVLNSNIRNLLVENIKNPLMKTLLLEEVNFKDSSLNELSQFKLGISLDYSKLSSCEAESLSNEDIQAIVRYLTSIQYGLDQKEKLFHLLSCEVKKQVLQQMTFKELDHLFDLSFFVDFVASDKGGSTLILLNKKSNAFQKLIMKSHALIRKALFKDFSYETIRNLRYIFGARRIEQEIKSMLCDKQWLNLFNYENKTNNALFLAFLLKHNVSQFKHLVQKKRFKIKDILTETKWLDHLRLAIEKLLKMAENNELPDYEMDSFLEYAFSSRNDSFNNYVLSSQMAECYYSRLEKLMQDNAERLLLSNKNNAILEANSVNYFNLLHLAIKHWDAEKLTKVLKSKTLDNQKIINVLRKMKFSNAYKMQVLKLL